MAQGKGVAVWRTPSTADHTPCIVCCARCNVCHVLLSGPPCPVILALLHLSQAQTHHSTMASTMVNRVMV